MRRFHTSAPVAGFQLPQRRAAGELLVPPHTIGRFAVAFGNLEFGPD